MEFVNAFGDAFFSEENLWSPFTAAHEATDEKYPEVYSSKMETVISILLSNGTQRILDGNNNAAIYYATLAFYFEEWIAINLRKTKATFSLTKVLELNDADEHTLVSYYRKRNSCSCLDEKYKEVKSVKKMGFCCNPSCTHPGRVVERSTMFSCTRCCSVNYCSVECQKASWKEHREVCGKIGKKKAAFNSEQQSAFGKKDDE